MTYELFKETLIIELKGHFPPDTMITIHSLPRNNHTSVEGLTILESGFNIAPTIYVQEYYEHLKQGHSFSAVFKQILDTYYQCRPSENINPAFFSDFENIKQHIVFKLIHAERNRELLTTTPHIPFLDLAIVFYCLVASDSSGTATILIQNEHLLLWHTNTQNIYQLAKQNTPHLLSYHFESMFALLEEFSLAPDKNENYMSDTSTYPMYILTNNYRFLGAACLLYDNLMNTLSQRLHADLYIIPSSIHEVLIVPAAPHMCREEFNQMIQEVNAVQLEQEEILSDHVYYYSREKNQITSPA